LCTRLRKSEEKWSGESKGFFDFRNRKNRGVVDNQRGANIPLETVRTEMEDRGDHAQKALRGDKIRNPSCIVMKNKLREQRQKTTEKEGG